MQIIVKEFKQLAATIEQAMKQLNIESEMDKLEKLQSEMREPSFWDNPEEAARISQQATDLKKHTGSWQGLLNEAKEALALAEMGDGSLEQELTHTFKKLTKEYSQREFELKLSGPHDKSPATLSIYAGTGGTDAQDWAEMLLRMYLRFSEKNSFKTEIINQSSGEEAGIKSVTFEVNGPYAFGKLKSEKGVHRLVRLSPFNSDNLRQTSFALVEVLPQLEHPEQVEIDPKDLKIDVFRAGGHGGQSVNTTDSAVRVTHLPTGTVVTIQNERSQLQNKEKAMGILKAKLTALMLEQQKAEIGELKGSPQSAEWGNQIRSYILHPYTKVKDHRTGAETAQAKAVLDGEIGIFIEAYLKKQIGSENK
ncbi:MAG TPA: peptide chain release factor 2 [Candidatus Dormibacteraeota bacterium]|nr:peptide chain release factor 2 [Candidatus Dormibacteraeota bacterium]